MATFAPRVPTALLGDPRRASALADSGLLDAPAEPRFDRVTRLACDVLGTPVSLLSVVDVDRQFLVSQVGLPEPTAPRRQARLTHSLCQHVVATDQPLVVPDARLHPVLGECLADDELDVVAYLGVPVRWHDGEVLGAICVIAPIARHWSGGDVDVLTGIAEQVHTELALRRSAAELEQTRRRLDDARRLRADLIGATSHELRTPLVPIIGAAELLATSGEALTAEQRAELVGAIVRGGHRLEGLVQDLLTLREADDPSDGRMVRVSLRQVLDRAIGMLGVAAPRIEVDAGADVALWVDPDQVAYVIRNLLQNAMVHGRPPIVVRAADAGWSVTVTVEDAGDGVPLELADEVFEPFTQASRGDRRTVGGLGNGLAVSRRLVKLNGGTLRHDPDCPSGARFVVTLPRMPATRSEPDDGAPAPAARSPRDERPASPRRRGA